MNRNTALNIIRAEYAEHGTATRTSALAHAESRIGFAAYTDARLAGMKLFNEAHKHD